MSFLSPLLPHCEVVCSTSGGCGCCSDGFITAATTSGACGYYGDGFIAAAGVSCCFACVW